MVGLLAVMLSSAKALDDLPGMAEQGRTAYQNMMIPFAALRIAAVLIVLQVVSSVINQRRRNLALLALQGATPWQLTSLTCLRVFVSALAASVVSLAASFLLARPLYAWEASQFMIGRQSFINSHQLASWAAGASRSIGGLDRHAADHPNNQPDQSSGIPAGCNYPSKGSGCGSSYRRRLVPAASIGIPWAHWALVYLLLTSAASLASRATVRKSARRSPAGVIAQHTGE